MSFAVNGLLSRISSVVGHPFRRYLLLSNCAISMCMGAAGDAVQQQWDISRNRVPAWSLTRIWHMTLAGLTTGATCHYWYVFLDRHLPGRTLRLVMKKVILDQIVFSPVWISIYFLTLGLLEGSCTEVVKEELLEKGSQIYVAEWVVWPPAQVINFTLLPTRYRVLFDSVISFGFDIYSPYVKYRTGKTHNSLPTVRGEVLDCPLVQTESVQRLHHLDCSQGNGS